VTRLATVHTALLIAEHLRESVNTFEWHCAEFQAQAYLWRLEFDESIVLGVSRLFVPGDFETGDGAKLSKKSCDANEVMSPIRMLLSSIAYTVIPGDKV
jgi:hypothetical protein